MRGALLLLAAISCAPAVAANPPVELVTLGTGGGPVVQTRRAQPANAVRVGDAVYLFDVGEGTQRQMEAARLPLASVRAVFLTHHHLDHVGGLGPLIANRWVQMRHAPLPVIGPPGTLGMVAGLVQAYRPIELAPVTLGPKAPPPMASGVDVRDLAAEMDSPALVYQDEAIRVFAVVNDHYHFAPGTESARTARSYAYRIEAGGRSIVLTGDTGPSRRVEALAKGADLLVSEVMDRAAIARDLAASGFSGSALEGFMKHMDANHLTPALAGEMAARAGVRALVLSHLVPGRDGDTSDAGYVHGLAGRFTGPVTVAKDLDRFAVGEEDS
jgi:ribonuclease BN (tRNA processing enzyme)